MDYSSPSDTEEVPNVQYVDDSLFAVQPGSASLLAHACNCRGTWGAGVAAGFRQKFPAAYSVYRSHCQTHASNPSGLLGTCLLIHNTSSMPGGEYWIACLFTSVGTGQSVAPPNEILEATRLAVTDLLRQLHTHRFISTLRPGDDYIPVINMPKINAGLFRVPWERTEAILRAIPYRFNIYVPF